MQIKNFLEADASISVSVSVEDLREFMLDLINESKQASVEQQEEEVYKTPDETAAMLNVDKSTLWRWAKQGYLVPVKWGRKSRYKLSDIKVRMEG